MKERQRSFYAAAEKQYQPFPKELFKAYGVKRGLRNEDETGVMAGLTAVGQVKGYYIEDGEKMPMEGHLKYRGYDIYDIVENCEKEGRFGYEEVAFLLLFGELPNRDTLQKFTELLGDLRALPEGFAEDMILKAPSANIMNKMARSVLAMYSYDDNPDETTVDNILRQSIELIARLPVMAAVGYQAKRHYHDGDSMYLHVPQKNLSTAENLLYMLRPDNKYTRQEAEMLDALLMIQAEHGGGNNSAFTTRVVSSSGTDTYSAIAAAIGSLKGPKHGGANAKVVGMVEDFKENLTDITDKDQVARHIEKVFNRETFDKSGLVYGMGHALYTKSDPRAVALKRKAEELAYATGNEDEFKLYNLIEELTPQIFTSRKGRSYICANVDLYSGFVYKCLNIPTELYTPLFAIARMAGWCAHRIEEVVYDGKIIRPAYKHVCKNGIYVPMSDR